jgi:hypothetical protein
MTTIGEKLGQGARPQVGVGASLSPKDMQQEKNIFYRTWQQGIIANETPEMLPEDAAQLMIDTEVDKTDALIRAPGLTQTEDVTPRSARYIFQHANVDFTTELVIVDPPYVGHRHLGVWTFANLGIAATSNIGWNAANIGGTLIFSNGRTATYTRQPETNVVTDISANIIAECFATAFGRTFAGAFTDPITGLQSLGIAWNAANGSVADWAGLGSGAEFLLANELRADRIVTMVPLGLDTLGILNRKSLWAGFRTGDSNRPADFQLRFSGLGCISATSAASCPAGIVYLSDDGVCLFDLNSSQVISRAVDSLLLPIDYSRINAYQGIYISAAQRYILNTPLGIFIYEFAHDKVPSRWFFRSFVADNILSFVDQAVNPVWSTVVGPWNLQTLTWAQMVIDNENQPSIMHAVKGTKIAVEDYAATTYMGVAQTPLWISRQDLPDVTDIIETHAIEVQYRCTADASVTFTATDTNGNLTSSITKTLINTSGVRKRKIFYISTMVGMATEFQITFGANAIAGIERIRRIVMEAGETEGAAG